MGSQILIAIKKLTDFCCFNEFRIMNSFYKYKHFHKFTWQARYPKSALDYTNGKEKLTKIINDGRDYKGVELNTANIY